MQDTKSMPEQTSRVTTVHSSNWRRSAIAAVIIAFLAGTIWYLVGIKTNHNTSQDTQRISFRPTPTIIKQSSASAPSPSSQQATAGPSLSMWIYRNERLGFEFRVPEFYEVMEETANMVTFGSGEISYLTISTNQITDYKSYRLCEDIDEANINWQKDFPCLQSGWEQEGAIAETTLGGVSAKSLYITEGVPDWDYHIVQTNGSPKIEAKMYISGGQLDWNFKRMLSTFKFLSDM